MVSDFLVVLLRSGPHAGNIAVIAEIIDHNRVRSRSVLGYNPFLNFCRPSLMDQRPVSPAMPSPTDT